MLIMHPLSFAFLVVVTACQATEVGLVLLHIRKACGRTFRGRATLVQNVCVACLPAPALLALLPRSPPVVQAAGVVWAVFILVAWYRRPKPEQIMRTLAAWRPRGGAWRARAAGPPRTRAVDLHVSEPLVAIRAR